MFSVSEITCVPGQFCSRPLSFPKVVDIQGRSGHGKVPFVLGIFFFLMVLCNIMS